MRAWRVVMAVTLAGASLVGCHVNSFEFTNETGQPIVLTFAKQGEENSVSLPVGGTIGSLPGPQSYDHVRYRYGNTTCRLAQPFPKLRQQAWNKAKQLPLLPCEGPAR